MEWILKNTMHINEAIFYYLLFFKTVFAIIIIFFKRKEPKSVWAWLMLIYIVPIIGFMLYIIVGADFYKQKLFKNKAIEDQINKAIREQEFQFRKKNLQEMKENISSHVGIAIYNLNTSGAMYFSDNDVDIIIDGNDKFNRLIEDIKEAKEFIHMQYYIIKDDILFQRIEEALIEKAKEGVEIRILYDAMGSREVPKKRWNNLEQYGIKTASFFPALFGRFQIRANYRNHRKIVVIDNKIGYVGGFNIGKEYIGLDEKFGYWRDTHLRIHGGSVLSLQLRFLLDWNYAANENLFRESRYHTKGYPGNRDFCEMQIISSGPDNNIEQIRGNYLKLIYKAKKSIYIQSPYFIPDRAILDALYMAISSGIEVNIMIPCKPDHPFVYWATYSYVGDLVLAGAHCYVYNNGFLHAKGMIIDSKILCYGTANMDIRSFSLNFEVNAIIYNKIKAKEMEDIFLEDIKVSTLITKENYMRRKFIIRFKEQISRLFSPVL